MSGLPLIVQPLRPPKCAAWVQWEWIAPWGSAKPYAIERWYNRGQETQVVSAIEIILPEGGTPKDQRPEYHLSVSGLRYLAASNYRCSDSRARWALKQFGFENAFEDNHVPDGKVRNFWRPVADSLVGEICPCVDTEPTIRAMKGDYVWRGVPYDTEKRR